MRRARGAGFWVGLLAVLVVFAVLGGRAGRVDGPPLDPRSTSPLGARALVLLLEDLGATVEVASGIPDDPDVVVLLLADNLGADQRADLERLVARGARVVVADPHSRLAAPVTGSTALLGPFDGGALDPSVCDEPALARVGAVDPGSSLLLRARRGDRTCFGDGQEAFVVVSSVGRGVIVSVGGAAVFTNERLDDADNAVLAAALLAPTPGTRVVLPSPVLAAEGDDDLLDAATDLVGPGLPFALLQLVLAFVVYALHRARRLGRPVDEPQPVAIAGSELVLAVGRLLARTGSPGAAAALVRGRLRQEVGERTGLPAGADPRALADAVAPLTSLSPDDVYRALADLPVADDAELLELVALVDGLRQEVVHGGRATAHAR